MNKAEMVQTLASKTGLTQAQTKAVFESLIDMWTEALAKGDVIAMAGFGNFKPTTRAARKGINPKTKEAINIPAKKGVGFKAALALKEALNK